MGVPGGRARAGADPAPQKASPTGRDGAWSGILRDDVSVQATRRRPAARAAHAGRTIAWCSLRRPA